MLSFWEKETWFRNLDLVVVGGGLVGLTTALSYQKRFPRSRILVLERAPIGLGASTRNAGFACYGSPSELLDDMESSAPEAVWKRVEQRWTGFQKLVNLLGPKNMGYEPLGGRELFRSQALDPLDAVENRLSELNQVLKDVFGAPPFEVEAKIPVELGLKGFARSIRLPFEGQIDTGRTLHSLMRLAREKDIELLHGLKVVDYEDAGWGVWVDTEVGRFRTRNLALCTNGFARQLWPEASIQPARAQVLITEPISGLGLKGIYHVHKGYYYFRNVGDRILLGGGRHKFRQAESTARLVTTAQVQKHLEQFLRRHLSPGLAPLVSESWAGIMGFGAQNEKAVLVEKMSARVVCGVRLGGMGIAIGASVGEQTAALIDA
ncbi:FAD-dependent oxidoreductase [bacterium]|nr:FAD-dependent oxidoreductase [bacterium]